MKITFETRSRHQRQDGELHTGVSARTCSERWLVRPDRTAPWFCAPGRRSRWILRRTWALLVPATQWTGTDVLSATVHPTMYSGVHQQCKSARHEWRDGPAIDLRLLTSRPTGQCSFTFKSYLHFDFENSGIQNANVLGHSMNCAENSRPPDVRPSTV